MSKAEIVVLDKEPIGTISPFIHGHFAEHLGRCCYDGIWVGRDSKIPNMNGFRTDIVEAFKKVGIPMLRWPGGCFADSYHWRDGIGPNREPSVQESCGIRVVENNQLGTHEFIDFCNMIGATPYLAGNVGSGSPKELCDWISYCNDTGGSALAAERAANGHAASMNVKYWGVGNENWGCGGNYDPADYGKEYRRYSTFIKMADSSVELVACGNNNRDWNMKVVEQLRNHLHLLDHFSVHQYWGAGHSTEFDEEGYYHLMRGVDQVEEDLKFTDEILQFFVAGRRKVGIAFDEWGAWHTDARPDTNYEAGNTLRDAVSAAGALDLFNRWCDKVSMANLAQIVNVLQTLAQTKGDKMWLTPTYHLFALYAPHRDALSLKAQIVDAPTRDNPKVDGSFPVSPMPAGSLSMVSTSASKKDGKYIVSVTNRHMTDPMEITIRVPDVNLSKGTLMSLTADAPNAVNSAEQPNRVNVQTKAVDVKSGSTTLVLPPCSVQTLVLG